MATRAVRFGDCVFRDIFDIGGHSVVVFVEVVPPRSSPGREKFTDFPGLRLQLTLPHYDRFLHPDFVAPDTTCLGGGLIPEWGSYSNVSQTAITMYSANLAETLAEIKRMVEDIVQTLREVVAKNQEAYFSQPETVTTKALATLQFDPNA